MNQKDDLNQPLPKGEFQEHLETLIKVVATKYDLKELEGQITDKITDSQDKILASNDKIAKKLDTILTELPVLNEKQREHTNRIETLETKTRHIQARLGI